MATLVRTMKLATVALLLGGCVSPFLSPTFVAGAALPLKPGATGECQVKVQRKSWQNLTQVEKDNYINATLCLINSPPKSGIPGAKSRWEELQYAHAAQADYIHFVAPFLPWHRYFLGVHEHLLRNECGYEGVMPYWDLTADAANLTASSILDNVHGFGGNGDAHDHCLRQGPFANLTLHFDERLNPTSYCLTRILDSCTFKGAAQVNIDNCMKKTTFQGVWHCIEGLPHMSGHGGIGGLMVNTWLSPGDPIFYLHHGWIDKLWWQWQTADPQTRLHAMSGPNAPIVFTFPTWEGAGSPNHVHRWQSPEQLSSLAALDQCFTGFAGGNFTFPANFTLPSNFTFPANFTLPANFTFPGNVSGTFPSPFNVTPRPNPALTDYFHDGGNATTMNHTMWSAGIRPNATIGDVMSLDSPLICAEYVE